MGFFHWLKGVGQKIGHGISVGAKAVGHAISVGAKKVGKVALKGLDYGIQGLKIATDYIDDIPVVGLATSFIPYYGLVKAGIDVADELRKVAKGEQKFNWATAGRIGLDVGMGALSAVGGRAEVRAYKAGAKAFKSARNIGEGIGSSLKAGGEGIISQSPMIRGSLRLGGKVGRAGAKIVRKARGLASTEAYQPSTTGELANLLQ